jgi:hypothetical protein
MRARKSKHIIPNNLLSYMQHHERQHYPRKALNMFEINVSKISNSFKKRESNIKKYNRMIVPSEFGNSPQELNRKQAQRFFLWFMESINYRMSILQEFIICNGEHVLLDYSPVSLIDLWEWFENYIEIRNMTADEVKNELNGRPKWFRNEILEDTREISDFTLAIGLDIAIYFAETFRKNRDGIYWDYINKPKSHFSYNRPVLLGFVNDIDLDPILITTNCIWKSVDERNSRRLYELYEIWLEQ